MATTSTSTAETSTSNYLIPDDSQELFQNITTFAKNMTLKDSVLYEEAETATSKWMGSLLIKYYEHTLTIEDVKNLLIFVGIYNKTISDRIGKIESLLLTGASTTSEDADTDSKLYFLKILGMYNGQEYSSSFLNLLVESFIADNYEEHPDWVDKKLFITYIFFCLMFSYDSLCIDDYIKSFDNVISDEDDDNYFKGVGASQNDIKISFPNGLAKIVVDNDDSESESEPDIKIYINNTDLTRSNIITDLFNKYYGLIFAILFKMAYDKKDIALTADQLDPDYFLNVLSMTGYSFIGSDDDDNYDDDSYLIRNNIDSSTLTSQILTSSDDNDAISNLDYIASLTFMRDIITVQSGTTDGEYYIDLASSSFATDYLEIFEAILEYVNENNSSLKTIILNLIGKEKYIFYQSTYGSESYGATSKLMASELERKYASAGYALNFFDLRVPWDSVSGILSNTTSYDFTTGINLGVADPENETTTLPDSLSDVSSSNREYGMIGILIAYKELNVEYRNTIRADLLDYALYKQRINMRKVIASSTTSYTAVSIDAANYPRSASDDLIIIRDYRSSEDVSVISTSKLFKYQYTNAYMCRSSVESDCISYYIADPYISDRYGRYTYQETEIYNFLSLYKETRDFYYRVLLNEAFTKETEYFLYEKSFIIFYTIERFLTSKLDNLKDVDSFDMTDTENFLISYGFESLVDIINLTSFYNSEELSKRLIKYYIDLTSYKGSRKVIDILQDVFSLPNGTLTIYKEILVKVKDEDDGSYSYKFVRISEDNDNIYEELITGISSGTSLDVFVEEDKYWNASNTPESTLVEIGLQWTNTKYIIPEVVSEISEAYVVTRCIFALIDYLFNMVEVTDNEDWYLLDNLIVEDEDNLNADYNVTMYEYITAIRALFRQYLEVKFKDSTIDYSEYYDTIFKASDSDSARTDVSFKLGSSYDRDKKSFTSTFKQTRLERLNLAQFYTNEYDDEYGNLICVNSQYVKGYFRCSTVSSDDDSCYSQPTQIEVILDALIPILTFDGLLDNLVAKIEEEQTASAYNYIASLPSTFSTSNQLSEEVIKTVINSLPTDIEVRNHIIGKLKKRYGIDLNTGFINPISTLASSDTTEEVDMEDIIFQINRYFRSRGYANTSSILTQEGLREYAANYYLHLPLIIINGSFFDNAEYDEKGITFMQLLYEGIYFDETEEDTNDESDDGIHNILYSAELASGIGTVSDDAYADDDTDAMANAIISMCSNLADIFNQSVQLNLTESQNALINFLSEAISYFISYTTCIYDFYYMNSYNSEGEALGIIDRLMTVSRRAAIDSVFYDESVKLRIAKRKVP